MTASGDLYFVPVVHVVGSAEGQRTGLDSYPFSHRISHDTKLETGPEQGTGLTELDGTGLGQAHVHWGGSRKID